MFEAVAKAGIGHVIQLAVAPVFLLTSVGAILNVMSNRLSRIIDRARALELRYEATSGPAKEEVAVRLRSLSQRARLVSHCIVLAVITAVLVCAVIITLFLGEFLGYSAVVPAALLFIAALLAFLLSLIGLAREIFMATSMLRFGPG